MRHQWITRHDNTQTHGIDLAQPNEK